MSAPTDRQRQRAAGQELFDSIAAGYADRAGVSRATMFGSEGLRYEGKFFAFVGAEGDIIVKLPAERVAQHLAEGAASAVHIGRNAAREWASVPMPGTEDLESWREAIEHAYRYATGS